MWFDWAKKYALINIHIPSFEEQLKVLLFYHFIRHELLLYINMCVHARVLYFYHTIPFCVIKLSKFSLAAFKNLMFLSLSISYWRGLYDWLLKMYILYNLVTPEFNRIKISFFKSLTQAISIKSPILPCLNNDFQQ